ncbi:hypothetical protein [Streptomyces sp. TLI_053]|uniref:hypothetical protein n=1 Tax=Streptomyces sp. TLI_053 TaxID=1855352 RepID=UPI0013520E80|nr:hypothetical protein [Streptomyces sp. TLI_053]
MKLKKFAAGLTSIVIAGSILVTGTAAHAAPAEPMSVSVSVTELPAGTATEASTGVNVIDAPVLVDPRQDHNAVNCRFGKNEADREKYCKALGARPMTETAKNCLIRMGVGGAAALIAGKVNKKVAREITVNTVAAGASGCLTALLT